LDEKLINAFDGLDAWLYFSCIQSISIQYTQQKIKHITYNKGKGVWYPVDTV